LEHTDIKKNQVNLAHGFQLEIGDEGKHISLNSEHGHKMKIVLSPEGPVVEMDAPRVVFRNTGDLSFEAECIELKSRGELRMDVGGTCTQRIAGDLDMDVRDDIHMKAQAASLKAVRGGISVTATDDLDLQGLRILHNVPSEDEILEQLEKVKTFGDLMKCPAWDPNAPKKMPLSEPVERKDW